MRMHLSLINCMLSITNTICFSQGVILVYDITNRWSFDGIDRWIKEIDEVKSDLSDPKTTIVFRVISLLYLMCNMGINRHEVMLVVLELH